VESFRIRELQAQVDAARDQARIAGESDRPRLDLQAWALGQGYGSGTPRPAFEQIGTARAGGVFAGLTFEMPLNGSREAAEKAAARFALEIARHNLDAAVQQVDTEAATWVTRRDSADRRLELAGRTEEASRRQAEAERRRYEVGTAIPLQVQQAEDSLRQARLRVLRARVDRIQAEFGLGALTGELLRRIGAGDLAGE
jgi:outer membrane protein TolC